MRPPGPMPKRQATPRRPSSHRKTAPGPSTASNGHPGSVEKDRELKDRFMATQPESPFSEANHSFHGLRYFPIDPSWCVEARFEAAKGSPEVLLRTSEDGHAAMRQLGTLTFTREGRTHRLSLFHAGPQAGNVAFLPFRDRTSGKESYGPGRYLNLELQPGNRYLIDFNQAFNPYCAYVSGYECPFPPVENDLQVSVEAGEKVYDLENNPSSPEEAIRQLTLRFRERLQARKAEAQAPAAGRPHGTGRDGA